MASDLKLPLILRTANTEDLFCTGHAKLLFFSGIDEGKTSKERRSRYQASGNHVENN